MKVKNVKTYKVDVTRLTINILILLGIIVFLSITMSSTFGKKQFKTEITTVFSGDTIWKFANNICSNNENLSIENVINDIKQINNIESSNIFVGQELLLPIYD